MFKNKFFWILVAIAAISFTLTSFGDKDNDNENTKPPSEPDIEVFSDVINYVTGKTWMGLMITL